MAFSLGLVLLSGRSGLRGPARALDVPAGHDFLLRAHIDAPVLRFGRHGSGGARAG